MTFYLTIAAFEMGKRSFTYPFEVDCIGCQMTRPIAIDKAC